MKVIKRMALAVMLILSTYNSSKAQTEVTAPMTGTPAPGSYFSYTGITLNPGFSFTATAGNSLSLFTERTQFRLPADCQQFQSEPELCGDQRTPGTHEHIQRNR